MATLSRRTWKTRAGDARTGYEVEWFDPSGKRRRRLFSGNGALKPAKALRSKVESDPTSIALPPGGRNAAVDQAPAAASLSVKQMCDAWIASVKAAVERERLGRSTNGIATITSRQR